jgi:four helix bundle protein
LKINEHAGQSRGNEGSDEAVCDPDCDCLSGAPASREGNVLGNQLLRSGTAVAANYRAVCRARSKAEFVSKMSIVVEEADETVFWLEMLVDTRIVPSGKLTLLLKEANESLAICAASLRTAKYNRQVS